MSFSLRTSLLLLSLALLLAPRAARSETVTLDGRWQAGAMVARWRIGEWGPACGPQPSGGNDPGGQVTIKQAGNELTISGLGRTYSTGQCWRQESGTARTAHSASPRAWQTTCATAASNPRRTTLQMRMSASDTQITFEETGQYAFVASGQNCTASSGQWRTYTLLSRAGASEEAAAATALSSAGGAAGKPPAPADPCASPGPPTRLEVTPQHKLLQPGQQFRFAARVLDAQGCRANARVRWSLQSGGERVRLADDGELSVPQDASDGEVRLRATVGSAQVEVTAVVTSPGRYAALLAAGGFDESGEVLQGAGGTGVGASIGADSAITQDDSGSRKRWFVGAVATVALLLGLGGVVLTLRTRHSHHKRLKAEQKRHKRAQAEHAARQRAREQATLQQRQTQRMVCPACGSFYANQMKFCSKDGTALLPSN